MPAMSTPPPPDQWPTLGPIDETDRYWQRHLSPLIDRLEREYPAAFAYADRVLAQEAQGLAVPLAFFSTAPRSQAPDPASAPETARVPPRRAA